MIRRQPLTLRRETVRVLGAVDLGAVHGGMPTAPSYATDCGDTYMCMSHNTCGNFSCASYITTCISCVVC